MISKMVPDCTGSVSKWSNGWRIAPLCERRLPPLAPNTCPRRRCCLPVAHPALASYLHAPRSSPRTTQTHGHARTACPQHHLTKVNGIKRNSNGTYTVYLRLLGEGTTRVLTERAMTFDRAVEIRDLAIRAAGVPASAVGLSREPLGLTSNKDL